VSDKHSKWDGEFPPRLSAETLKFEIGETVGDIETIAEIMIAIGHHEVQTDPCWWRFFARQLEHLTERLTEASRRAQI
jgi:hypothetical protein